MRRTAGKERLCLVVHVVLFDSFPLRDTPFFSLSLSLALSLLSVSFSQALHSPLPLPHTAVSGLEQTRETGLSWFLVLSLSPSPPLSSFTFPPNFFFIRLVCFHFFFFPSLSSNRHHTSAWVPHPSLLTVVLSSSLLKGLFLSLSFHSLYILVDLDTLLSLLLLFFIPLQSSLFLLWFSISGDNHSVLATAVP